MNIYIYRCVVIYQWYCVCFPYIFIEVCFYICMHIQCTRHQISNPHVGDTSWYIDMDIRISWTSAYISEYPLKSWERPGRWEHHQKWVWVLRPEVECCGCSVLNAFKPRNPLKVHQHSFNIWLVYWHPKWIINDLQSLRAGTFWGRQDFKKQDIIALLTSSNAIILWGGSPWPDGHPEGYWIHHHPATRTDLMWRTLLTVTWAIEVENFQEFGQTEVRQVVPHGTVWFGIPCSSWIFMLGPQVS